MPIVINLDVMMAKRKISAGELAERVGITPANLSILKNNKAKAVRFSTLEALCKALDCQPADLLEYVKGRHQDIVLLYPVQGFHLCNGIRLKTGISAQIFADVVHQEPCILLFRCHHRYLFHPPSPLPCRIWPIVP